MRVGTSETEAGHWCLLEYNAPKETPFPHMPNHQVQVDPSPGSLSQWLDTPYLQCCRGSALLTQAWVTTGTFLVVLFAAFCLSGYILHDCQSWCPFSITGLTKLPVWKIHVSCLRCEGQALQNGLKAFHYLLSPTRLWALSPISMYITQLWVIYY